jgi:hypothetical protein
MMTTTSVDESGAIATARAVVTASPVPLARIADWTSLTSWM